MPSPPLQPRGPLPARVYWRRRLVLLGIALALVAGFARILGGSSDGSDNGGQATTAAVTTTSPTDAATTETVKKKRKKQRTATEPPLAEPTGPCVNSDIVATPVVTEALGDSDVPIALNLRTVSTPACTWSVSPETLTVSITSGDDPIWSSRECPASIVAQDVVVRQAVDAPIVVVWEDARRSDEGCTAQREWALPGYYHVEAAALGGEPTEIQFELGVKPSAVITRTITPKPESTGKNKQADTEHTPGEQGSGNSEG